MLEKLSVFTPTSNLSIYPAGCCYEFPVCYLFVLAGLFKGDKSRNLNTVAKYRQIQAKHLLLMLWLLREGFFYMQEFQCSDLNT